MYGRVERVGEKERQLFAPLPQPNIPMTGLSLQMFAAQQQMAADMMRSGMSADPIRSP
jgi:hypothetical protein